MQAGQKAGQSLILQKRFGMRTKQRNNLAETARHERVAQNTDVYAVKARNYKGLRRGSPVLCRNYWRSVLVAFILMLFVSGGGSAVSNSWNQITSSGTSDDSYYTEYFDDGDIGHFYYNSGTSIPGMLVSGIIAAGSKRCRLQSSETG